MPVTCISAVSQSASRLQPLQICRSCCMHAERHKAPIAYRLRQLWSTGNVNKPSIQETNHKEAAKLNDAMALKAGKALLHHHLHTICSEISCLVAFASTAT